MGAYDTPACPLVIEFGEHSRNLYGDNYLKVPNIWRERLTRRNVAYDQAINILASLMSIYMPKCAKEKCYQFFYGARFETNVSQIAHRLGYSRHAVAEAVAWLRDHGLVDIEYFVGFFDGQPLKQQMRIAPNLKQILALSDAEQAFELKKIVTQAPRTQCSPRCPSGTGDDPSGTPRCSNGMEGCAAGAASIISSDKLLNDLTDYASSSSKSGSNASRSSSTNEHTDERTNQQPTKEGVDGCCTRNIDPRTITNVQEYVDFLYHGYRSSAPKDQSLWSDWRVRLMENESQLREWRLETLRASILTPDELLEYEAILNKTKFSDSGEPVGGSWSKAEVKRLETLVSRDINCLDDELCWYVLSYSTAIVPFRAIINIWNTMVRRDEKNRKVRYEGAAPTGNDRRAFQPMELAALEADRPLRNQIEKNWKVRDWRRNYATAVAMLPTYAYYNGSHVNTNHAMPFRELMFQHHIVPKLARGDVPNFDPANDHNLSRWGRFGRA